MAKVQKGILSDATDAALDADVIMTAAIIGHAFQRLNTGKNCRFDLEVQLKPGQPTYLPELDLEPADVQQQIADHHNALAKINKALANGGLPAGKVAQLGITPFYDLAGQKVIIGGTGNMAVQDADRYDPGNWSSDMAKELYNVALGTLKDTNGHPIKVGYQGFGAYTGFVDGRQGGQTGLMSTYRFKVPDAANRWIPSDKSFPNPKLGAQIGNAPDQRAAWGIIGKNSDQPGIQQEGMYFQDQDTARGQSPLTEADIAGYVHGMIQAIYDVEWRKSQPGAKSGGTPYEIAVGSKTSKLASCFTCSIFMEATGHPASSTHLGKGESWCVLHPTATPAVTPQDKARQASNDKWAAYCQQILNKGMACMVTTKANLLNQDHEGSFAALKAYLANRNTPDKAYDFANLILDAVTVSQKEYLRVISTLA
ncbi:hypothetical protein EGT74_16625 [Chitinophaga lutea]|uniref:Uncharacterized protein n=1 Tax=Chitinophaga lutea TaxID=2488634 RepID=A0A3N4PJ11_9BACT|nr:hypothetical protein [Chitinophaga lutea]RPE08663.1 hypothetical protein EGT74_16625 [Chitinophaga lutea]